MKYGNIAFMAESEPDLRLLLREDLSKEYYAILNVVSSYDGDLRHAAVSLWLNSGVPATEVARRAGHSVAVLLKVYAHCIDGQADTVNKRIADALGSADDADPGW